MSVVINPTVATIGRSVTARYFGTGDGSRVLFNLAGLDSDRAYLMPVVYAQAPVLGAFYITCEGDSITGPATSRWPYLFAPGTFVDKGIAGSITSDMDTRYDTYKTSLGTHFAVLGGVNDIINSTAIATIKANLLYMWADAKARGVTVIAMTVTPADGLVTWTAPMQPILETLNAWILATALANGYVGVDTYTALHDPANPTKLLPAYDSGDHVHPSTAGTLAIMNAVASASGLSSAGWSGMLAIPASPLTNLALSSQAFSDALKWGAISVTAVDNSTTDPNGASTAAVLTATASGLSFAQAGIIATDTTITYSIYIGPGTHTAARFALRNQTTSTNFTSGFFDCTTRALTGVGWVKETIGGGWDRISFTQATGITVGDSLTIYAGGLGGANTVGVTWALWNAQVVAGSSAGPPIRTDTATRSIPGYTVDTTGKVTTSPALPANTIISYRDPHAPAVNIYRAFGMGDGTSTDFSLPFVPAVPLIYDNGSLQTITTHYTYLPNGNITFVSAPTTGHILTWTGNMGAQP